MINLFKSIQDYELFFVSIHLYLIYIDGFLLPSLVSVHGYMSGLTGNAGLFILPFYFPTYMT